MVFLLVALVGTAICVYGMKRINFESGWWITSAIGAVLFGIALISVPVSVAVARAEGYDKIEQFKSFKQTVLHARETKTLSEVERAAILTNIASWNQWLASEKYWSRGMFSWWHVWEVTFLDPLE